jgi:hypothetical protein
VRVLEKNQPAIRCTEGRPNLVKVVTLPRGVVTVPVLANGGTAGNEAQSARATALSLPLSAVLCGISKTQNEPPCETGLVRSAMSPPHSGTAPP